MLVYQKTMFDCYYCIKSFCCLEKHFGKFIFIIPIMARKSMKDSDVTKLCSLLFMLLLMTSIFVAALEWVYVK